MKQYELVPKLVRHEREPSGIIGPFRNSGPVIAKTKLNIGIS